MRTKFPSSIRGKKKFVEGRKRVESISEMIYCNEKIQGGATQFMDITI